MNDSETMSYVNSASRAKSIKKNLALILPVLSFLVVLLVFWWLKLVGITFAGEAFCGKDEHEHGVECTESKLVCETEENLTDAEGILVCEDDEHEHGEECFAESSSESEMHVHTDECYKTVHICGFEEHIHTVSCYSDIKADLETAEIWEATLPDIPEDLSVNEKIVATAKSQLGYKESTLNFEADSDDVKHGYTRYGEWYGNPYGEWSVMFTSFCLRYSGLDSVPISSGAETMRIEWEKQGNYRPVEEYVPVSGDIVFLDKNGNSTADSTAIVTGYEGGYIYAIEGNLEDKVKKSEYTTDSSLVCGYGVVSPQITPTVMSEEAVGTDDGQVTHNPDAVDEGDIGAPANYTVWLDGTNGGIMSSSGSANRSYTVSAGSTMILPLEWQSPDKYGYKLRGWFDIRNYRYYKPGDSVTVTDNMVFYADWEANTYDIGQFNSSVADTVSTNDFITTRMFDYGVLFNVLSETANVNVSSSTHSETWNLLTSGNNRYNGERTLNFIFRDWDRGSEDISYPNGHNDINNPTEAGTVYSGLYTDKLGSLLFDPETEVIGKNYIGEADHLFRYMDDPTDPNYGYYYYNSEYNAASYNQTDQRFYVYNYLECTRDSANSSDEGKYADFLPFNSPYANTNGRYVNSYTYGGVNGEYNNGTAHYMYDSRYNDNDNSTSYVGANFWFGMSIDIDFYLPNSPGTVLSDGSYGNRDIYGNYMHFRFTGDDDVWVFLDGKLVLDLGGLHGRETGDINFSTGEVFINGVKNTALSNTLSAAKEGGHKLTFYYLERGSSMSNCAIYFNLAPRFSFSIQKEDVLTRDILNGAQFSVYRDSACTVPAELWRSREAYLNGEASTNVFTVINGVAEMWGMGAGNTYYIKETKPPDAEGYGVSNGIIRLVFDKMGTATYDVEIIDGGEGVSGGFTIYGFRIDEETQRAYLVATNSNSPHSEVTQVHAHKIWNDSVDHTGEAVEVYLTVTDEDGTVRRLQEAVLTAENKWRITWSNLPKYREDGETPIVYGVEEAYVSGYYSKVEKTDSFTITETVWTQTNTLQNGQTYILRTSNGCLATRDNAEDTGFIWVNEATAKESPSALWTVAVRGQTVRLTNGQGQTLTFYYNGGSSGYPTDFFALKGSENEQAKQYLRYVSEANGIRMYYDGADNVDYYLIGTMTDAQKFNYSTSRNNALLFTPIYRNVTVNTETPEGAAYEITNTPLQSDNETSLKVFKEWDLGYTSQNVTGYEQSQVTVKLLADGNETGRTVTLSLRNGWTDTFYGLPYKGSDGNVIEYTVEESWDNDDWQPTYSKPKRVGSGVPTYEITVTNTYRWGHGYELPSTGGVGQYVWILSGLAIVTGTLVFGCILRRRQERRVGK